MLADTVCQRAMLRYSSMSVTSLPTTATTQSSRFHSQWVLTAAGDTSRDLPAALTQVLILTMLTLNGERQRVTLSSLTSIASSLTRTTSAATTYAVCGVTENRANQMFALAVLRFTPTITTSGQSSGATHVSARAQHQPQVSTLLTSAMLTCC